MEKKSRKSAIKWTPGSEQALIAIWRERIADLRGCRKNSHIVAEMMSEMQNQGFSYTVGELKAKMHNLTVRYRNERREIKKGGCLSKWVHYDHVHKILGSNLNKDSSVIESFQYDESSSNSSLTKCDPLSSTEPTSSFSFPRIVKASSLLSSESDTPLNPAKRKKDYDSEMLDNIVQQTEQGKEQLKILKNVAQNTHNLCELFGDFLRQQEENDKLFIEYFKKLVEKD